MQYSELSKKERKVFDDIEKILNLNPEVSRKSVATILGIMINKYKINGGKKNER